MTRSRHESLSKVQGRESLIFQTYVTFSIDLPDTYNDYLLANVIDSFLLLFWYTKAISPARSLRVSHLLLFMFLWILFLTKYDKYNKYNVIG